MATEIIATYSHMVDGRNIEIEVNSAGCVSVKGANATYVVFPYTVDKLGLRFPFNVEEDAKEISIAVSPDLGGAGITVKLHGRDFFHPAFPPYLHLMPCEFGTRQNQFGVVVWAVANGGGNQYEICKVKMREVSAAAG